MIRLLAIFSLMVTVHTRFTKDEIKSIKKVVDEELERFQKKSIKDEKSDPHRLYGHGNEAEIPTNKINECFDIYGSEDCRMLTEDLNMKCDEDELYKTCRKTCGHCEHHNRVDSCLYTDHGCCDDDVTAKIDESGSNCPACKDNREDLCLKNIADCNLKDFAGEWMRTNCKKSCGFCYKQCKDDPESDGNCGAWKEGGLCTLLPDMMSKHCKRTCGFCGIGNSKIDIDSFNVK